MSNRLANATSPYLRQHADNPVDWLPWGEEAFERARERDVPLFVSIGYSACHWCHVMAHESFEDPGVAAYLNEHFVPVKVDREERPDVDAVYLQATQALTGQAGWPMSVFTTPDGAPIFAGTYFPPRRQGRVPSFGEVCTAIAGAWRNDRGDTARRAEAIAQALAAATGPLPPAEIDAAAAIAEIRTNTDPVHGGFGGAPKFPQATALDALLAAGDAASVELAFEALGAMARGGIHDQLGGGFARYAVDDAWIVPHFEKMLVDNALLLASATRAWALARAGGDPRAHVFERAARGIVTWLETVARTAEGAFAASTDADSRDADGALREGAFFVWRRVQLDDVLGEDAADAAAVFGVTDAGTFERGASTLRRLDPADDPVDPAWFESVRARLAASRAERTPPARDDKVVTAWNGHTIDALVQAGLAFGEPTWIDAAATAARFLRDVHLVDGLPRRVSIDGVVGDAPGVAEDAGALAAGFARLGAATGDAAWLELARELLARADGAFGLEDGGYADARADASPIAARARELSDDPAPSGTSTLIDAARLVAALTDDRALADRAALAAETRSGLVARAPMAVGRAVRDALEDAREEGALPGPPPAQLVVVHSPGDRAAALALAAVGARSAPPGSAVVVASDGTTRFGTLLAGRHPLDGRPTAFVCRGTTCSLPVTSEVELAALLAAE
ncbi:thioredoxin domain-containing protein [Pseudoclavibacter chungangensis]|uniref:Thioredoxin domain-containing protein n=1 Tax=Pseudoclavibacter chungangensis TaxID=587635 RepID=A0A7J5C2Z8_9MICO|nr:thioredoxin domain-containing protein [Pseudoclavibacter chungangensis]KAB1662207.1 thioredoxin domain-containing protein [Pseudoclavibacter chungangensis]NYJ65404.1 hypothetical protein [Pseudoclavibacter chungangensis]